MLDLLEVARRAWSGPRMEEKEWNMALFHKVQALVKRHDITAPDPNDRSKIVCRDNAIIDAAWQAGIDFLVEQGVYCYDTRRVINFTEDEVKSTIRGIPETLVMGEGKDAVKASDKHMDGDDDPVLICGGFHSPYREDIAHLAPKAFMMIPGVDYMQGFTLKVIDGREIHGTAMAAYAARKKVRYMREGARKAGRPGMAICHYPISLEAAPMIATLDPRNGLRPCDGAMMTPLPNIVVETGLITAAIVFNDYGLSFAQNGNGHGEQDSFAGSREGYIVTGIAKSIAGWLIYRCNITNMSPNIVHEAFNRHTNMIRVHGLRWPDIMRRETKYNERYLLYFAQKAINCAFTGSAIEPSGGGRLEGMTPYEIEFMCDCADAARGLKVEDGIELISNIKKMADEQCPTQVTRLRGMGHRVSPTGWDGSLPTLRDVYDLVKMEPSEAYKQEMDKAKRLVRAAGLDID